MLQAYILFKARPVALVLIVALLLWSLGLPSWIGSAQAAGLTFVSDTLSNSQPTADSVHTVVFTTPSGVAASSTIRVTFDPSTNAFDLTGLLATDVTATSSAGAMTRVANATACSGAPREFVVTINAGVPDYVQLDMCTGDSLPAATTVTITIGGTNMINNPTTSNTSYVIRINGTMADSADTRVAIVDAVTVTAEVQTIFDFTVVGLNAGTSVGTSTTSGTTTATSVPFGIISPNTEYFLAQELRVNTNALNGFTVTVQADQTLTAGNGADIDTFIDGADTATATVWASPASTFGDEDTYGHWGITSLDPTTGPGGQNFVTGGPRFVGNFVANPVPIFYHGTAANYVIDPVQGQSFTRVGYQVEIGNLQEAGNDYQATIMYIATPVF